MEQLQSLLLGTPYRLRWELIEKNPIAGKILQFIWQREELWRTLVFNAHSALTCLCAYAIVEKVDHYIVDWLGVVADLLLGLTTRSLLESKMKCTVGEVIYCAV